MHHWTTRWRCTDAEWRCGHRQSDAARHLRPVVDNDDEHIVGGRVAQHTAFDDTSRKRRLTGSAYDHSRQRLRRGWWQNRRYPSRVDVTGGETGNIVGHGRTRKTIGCGIDCVPGRSSRKRPQVQLRPSPSLPRQRRAPPSNVSSCRESSPGRSPGPPTRIENRPRGEGKGQSLCRLHLADTDLLFMADDLLMCANRRALGSISNR